MRFIMQKSLPYVLGASALLFAAGCAAPGTHERRGTEVGAVAGAIIGGIIGHQSGETAAGAALGGALGGVTGAAVGADKDRQEARRYERGTVSAQPVRDQHGFTLDDYLRLMSDEEMEILQARGDAQPNVALGVLLTDQEKSNLRRRAAANREIGR